MDCIKVLSIDFDYFQDVAAETIHKYYPDGIDVSTELSEITWSVKYADGILRDSVKIRADEIAKMKEILLYQNRNIPVMIANSHRHIYDFIHKNVSTDEKLGVINVDMHHDIFNENDKLDCGNWLKFIMEEYDTKLGWICNPTSIKVYGFTENEASKRKKHLGEILPTTLDLIKEREFDIVFLCRSDNWSPIHLDGYFTELCNTITDHFNSVTMEKGINIPRKVSALTYIGGKLND